MYKEVEGGEEGRDGGGVKDGRCLRTPAGQKATEYRGGNGGLKGLREIGGEGWSEIVSHGCWGKWRGARAKWLAWGLLFYSTRGDCGRNAFSHLSLFSLGFGGSHPYAILSRPLGYPPPARATPGS